MGAAVILQEGDGKGLGSTGTPEAWWLSLAKADQAAVKRIAKAIEAEASSLVDVANGKVGAK